MSSMSRALPDVHTRSKTELVPGNDTIEWHVLSGSGRILACIAGELPSVLYESTEHYGTIGGGP